MIPISNRSEMCYGEYYLCYEIFEQGTKHLFIGKFTRAEDSSYGIANPYLTGIKILNNDIDLNTERWYIYEYFDSTGDEQNIFQLNSDEILEHFMVETI